MNFRSSRENRLWLWVVLIVLTIFSTLFIGQPLARILRSQSVQLAFFLTGMILVATVIFLHGLRTKPNKLEVTVVVGILAVYIMFFFRLGAPERSHLIEYSVLSIFIFSALSERQGQNKWWVAPLAFVSTFVVGVLDESIQILLPNRVFDPEDILFNGLAAAGALASTLALSWIRQRITKPKVNR